MKEFEISCLQHRPLSPTLVHKIMYIIVSRGGTYNTGKYAGSYNIVVTDGDGISETEESAAGEMIEKVPEIIDKYCSCDLTQDSLSIGLNGACGESIDYLVNIRPHENDRSVVTFKSSTDDVGGETGFLGLLSLVEEICRRLDFLYAGYRGEYDELHFPTGNEITAEHLQEVMYLSGELVSSIGREHIRSLPATDIRVHDDGGAFIIISPDPSGAYEKLQRVRSEFA